MVLQKAYEYTTVMGNVILPLVEVDKTIVKDI